MVYQVVASHRTGSTLLNDYALHYYDRIGFHELFLEDPSYKFVSHMTTEEKFEFLEYYKKQNIHFTFKTFPYKIIYEGYGERLYDFLKDYKILTIDRNPWDAFLSQSYQEYCGWATSHRWPGVDFVEVNSFEIDITKIRHFCTKWKIDFNFIKRLNPYNTFKYEDLTINNLQKYFNTNYESRIRPSNINYESLAINLKEAREIFDYEMYGARNGNNN